MKKFITMTLVAATVLATLIATVNANNGIVTVKPELIDEVIFNPDLGYHTSQWNWRSDTMATNPNYAYTSMQVMPGGWPSTTAGEIPRATYYRQFWQYLEMDRSSIFTEGGGIGEMVKLSDNLNYREVNRALDLARRANQNVLLAIAVHGARVDDANTINRNRIWVVGDVPWWYRQEVGNVYGEPLLPNGRSAVQQSVPYDERFATYWGYFVERLGQRYDGHPQIYTNDLRMFNYSGEEASMGPIRSDVREHILTLALENWRVTPLLVFNHLGGHFISHNGPPQIDRTTGMGRYNDMIISASKMMDPSGGRRIGWRADCYGDNTRPISNHMYNAYPVGAIVSRAEHLWKTGPQSMELGYAFREWSDGGPEGYLVNFYYEVQQANKWRTSTVNVKNSAIFGDIGLNDTVISIDNNHQDGRYHPGDNAREPAWVHLSREWYKTMGYRLALRSLSYPERVAPDGKLYYTSWWENLGCAPMYREYRFTFKLTDKTNPASSYQYRTDHDLTTWLPGDAIAEGHIDMTEFGVPAGEYWLDIGITGWFDENSYGYDKFTATGTAAMFDADNAEYATWSTTAQVVLANKDINGDYFIGLTQDIFDNLAWYRMGGVSVAAGASDMPSILDSN